MDRQLESLDQQRLDHQPPLLRRQVGLLGVGDDNLPGYFDLDLEFALPPRPGDLSDPAADHPVDSTPSIYTALPEQLGLKLESQKSSVEVLVIDNAQKPVE